MELSNCSVCGTRRLWSRQGLLSWADNKLFVVCCSKTIRYQGPERTGTPENVKWAKDL
jgi:hypothetical protein